MKKKIIIVSILLIITTLFAQDLIVPWFKVSGTLTTGNLVTGALTALGFTNTGTFTNTGKVIVTDSVRIGANTTTDNKVPKLVLKGDADSDAAAITKAEYTMTLTPNATPASAYWDVSSTYNRFRWGGATDYVSMEPTNTSGMLNIVAANAGNWTGINFSGAGFNDSNDYIWKYGTTYYRADGYLLVSNIGTAGSISAGTTLTAGTAITLNSTAADAENPTYVQKADFDADGSVLSAASLTIDALANADPTKGQWRFTSDNGRGFLFNLTVTTRDTVSAREAAGSVYTYFIPGGSLVSSSSREQKENIVERTMSNTDVLLDKVKIYQYNFKHDSLKSQHTSMMAEDWYEISAGFGGNNKEINYEHVLSFMLMALKNQNTEIKKLKGQITEMKSQTTLVK